MIIKEADMSKDKFVYSLSILLVCLLVTNLHKEMDNSEISSLVASNSIYDVMSFVGLGECQ